MSLDILVVDDEADICSLIADILQEEQCAVRTASNSMEAFEAIAEAIPDAIVLDIWLKNSELDGLGILETAQRKYKHVPVIMISGHGNIETAITSLRLGAYDYLEKPFKAEKLTHTLRRAIETSTLAKENSELRLRTGSFNVLIGNSPAVTQLRQAVERVAPTGSRVFINGQAGTGKEVMARAIHDKSARAKGPFITLNAASLSSDMVDHELFGTEDSEDLNAPPRKVGVFEQANGGTLFIDEVTDIPKESQGKLVRFLQDGSYERIGGSRRMQADVRVVAASQKDVQQEMQAGRLREDLYYRLNVVPLAAPSLKERREDIPLLADYFMAQAAETSKLQKRSLSDDAVAALQAYEWPGNVRQLRNVMEWLLIMYPEETDDITTEQLPREIFMTSPGMMAQGVSTDIMSMKLRAAREMFERQYLLAQIDRFGGNISRTANFIGMERSALHRKLKSLNVQMQEEKEKVSATGT